MGKSVPSTDPRSRDDSIERMLEWVRTARRPDYAAHKTAKPIRIADFFCGCGGLTLGAAQAAFGFQRAIDVRFAIDLDLDANAVYRANFPVNASVVVRDDI